MRGFSKVVTKAGIILLVFVAALCALWVSILFRMKPPTDEKLTANFYAHRASYESLRDMLLADQGVQAVYADFGVETKDSGLPHKPTELNFPVSRYNEYVSLLKLVGSSAAFKTKESQPELLCVGAWAAGWAQDTRHAWVCWTDREPANQVANLDDYYRNPARPHNVFRHIDGNWYLRADW
jgi:hypothetical protein